MAWFHSRKAKHQPEPTGETQNDTPHQKKDSTNPYGNPELWAKSTMPSYDSYSKNLVKVYEINKKDLRERVRERIWLHDVLDDNNIQYMIEIEGYKVSRKYYEKQCIYVEEAHKDTVLKYIAEYNKVKVEDIDEESMVDNIEDGLPQVKCASCGKEIDFDHVKCPFCKAPL